MWKGNVNVGKQNAAQMYGAQGRKDLLMLAPESITLITDPEHPLYDERVNLPIDESMVLNIMANGVIEAVGVHRLETKEGTIVACVYGRQRVKNAVEANKRLAKEGKETVLVPCKIERGDDSTLFGLIISENAIRRGDTPLVNARKVQKYLAMGRNIGDAAIQFGCSEQTIRNYLALLETDKAVQKAVEHGKIGAAVAFDIAAKIPREEQAEKVKELIESGATKGAAAKEAVRQQAKGAKPERKAKKRLRREPEIREGMSALRKADTHDARLALGVLQWVKGSVSSLEEWPSVAKALTGEEEPA